MLCMGCSNSNDEKNYSIDNDSSDLQEDEFDYEQTDIDNSGVNCHAGLPEDILSVVPQFSGKPYVELNNNVPYFSDEEKESKEAFERYSELDELGRCGVAYANICIDIMPTEKRGEIGQIKPSGWQLIKYDIVDGNYLYNRCHLIAYQLAGENANEKNLITGTRYLNVSGMLTFENQVAEYVKATGNHVLYRVTPIYRDSDLVATGVQMEAYSVEDGGAGICYNVFVYNSQPGIGIDYATGESWLIEEINTLNEETDNASESDASKDTTLEYNSSESNTSEHNGSENNLDTQDYVVNKNTKKFHLPVCTSVDDIKEKNKKEVTCNREELIDEGYAPCKRCNP
ncbi:MAG: DNA/RNA non-specific endonuclease [Lachnospiraceae bacterium]|nr:DNA/RNA non-specific endonuclease [Lachnospiraceae bacterium]